MTEPTPGTAPETSADMESPAESGSEEWPTHCKVCGTKLASATVDFDTSNEDRAAFNPGEMVAVDFCPNPECSEHPDRAAGAAPA